MLTFCTLRCLLLFSSRSFKNCRSRPWSEAGGPEVTAQGSASVQGEVLAPVLVLGSHPSQPGGHPWAPTSDRAHCQSWDLGSLLPGLHPEEPPTSVCRF